MPRIEGVSSRSITWFSRVKPSPLTTSLCFTGVQIAERTHFRWSLPPPALDFFAVIPNSVLLQLFRSFAAQGGYIGSVLQFPERIKCRLNDIVRIGCANGLGQHILNSCRRH